MLVEVGIIEAFKKEKQVPDPETRVIVAKTVALVLKEKPVGAFKMKVPDAGKSLLAFSTIVGPVSVVYEPPTVSAEIDAEAKTETETLAKEVRGNDNDKSKIPRGDNFNKNFGIIYIVFFKNKN